MPCPIRLGPLPSTMTASPLARRDLALLVVGAVVIRRVGRELGRARVDGLEDRPDAGSVAPLADRGLGASGDGSDLAVGEAGALGGAQRRRRRRGASSSSPRIS